MADRDDGGLLARVQLDQPARSVVAEPRDDDAVARLKRARASAIASALLRLLLQFGQALRQGLARPLGLGLGHDRRLAGLLGLLAQLLEDLPVGTSAARGSGPGRTRPARPRARAAATAARS